MNKEMKDFLYEFVDIGHAIENLILENERLEEDNNRLREENKKRFEMIMDMARSSQEGLHDFIKMVLDKEITINADNKE